MYNNRRKGQQKSSRKGKHKGRQRDRHDSWNKINKKVRTKDLQRGLPKGR